MNSLDFNFYSAFLLEKAGFQMKEDKIYLIESRLMPVVRKWKIGSISDMVPQLKLGTNKELVQDVIDAMMTNETLFFRDDKPFKKFRNDVLPAMLQSRAAQKRLRIWSAACSTGQEPYSIAMTLRDVLPTISQWHIDILATDLSQTALQQAKAGIFSQFEVQRGLPISLAMKNFTQKGTEWQISESLRNMVQFETFNLLDKMDRLGTFDIIFCRNVLIYFEEQVKKSVLLALSKRLAPDGFLFLGGSETIFGMSSNLEGVTGCSGLYMLKGAQARLSPPQPAVPVLLQNAGV